MNGTTSTAGRVHGGAIGAGATGGLLDSQRQTQSEVSYAMLLIDSTFQQCHALSGSGGAIFLGGKPSGLAVLGASIEGCTATEVGGGLALMVAAPDG